MAEKLKIVRRLAAAEGYLELGMPQHAMRELNAVDDPGPYQTVKSFLAGEALKAQDRYAEAAELLQRAAETAPLPQSPRVWMSLSECLRKNGQDDLADEAEQNARALANAGKAMSQLTQSGSVPSAILNIVFRFRRQ